MDTFDAMKLYIEKVKELAQVYRAAVDPVGEEGDK